MPLYVNGLSVGHIPSVASFLAHHSHFQIESNVLKDITVRQIQPTEPYLYVFELEAAVVSADDTSIEMIGLDEMTTCCCAVIRNTGSFAMAAGHFNGYDTKGALERMISGVQHLTVNWALRNNLDPNRYDYEVHLIGGFDDARNISIDVVSQLLEYLNAHPMTLHLRTACISSNNTYYQDGIPFPCITGLACYVKTGQIIPASFDYQGPLEDVRRLRFVSCPPKLMHSIYDPYSQMIKITPYDWTITDETIVQVLGLNTNSFLHYWSTSPLAEKPSFVPLIKRALRYLKDNRNEIFRGDKVYRFLRQANHWVSLEDNLIQHE